MDHLLTRLKTLARRPDADSQLLARFVAKRDDDAFAQLVWRHGPMVRRVCRRWLGASADAEDAFQAVFLILARRAAAISRPERLAGWLYGVALRTARTLRRRIDRRRHIESANGDALRRIVVAESPPDIGLRRLLDGELSRLPEKYRLPVILCLIEGWSRSRAAAELQLPEGTLSSRLAQARVVLRERLLQRGVAPAALTAALAAAPDAVAVTPALVRSTVQTAFLFVTQSAAASMPAAAALAHGVLRMWLIRRAAAAALVLTSVFVLGLGGALLVAQLAHNPQVIAESPPKPSPPALDLQIDLHLAGEPAKFDRIVVHEGGESVTVHSLEMLQRYLQRMRKAEPATPTSITVRAPDKSQDDLAAQVVTACRAAGFRDIRVQATPSDFAPAQALLSRTRLSPATSPDLQSYRSIIASYENALQQGRSAVLEDEFLASLKKFLETNPNDRDAPAAALMMGNLYQDAGKSTPARLYYELILRRFPQSSEAVLARRALDRIDPVGKPVELGGISLTAGGQVAHHWSIADSRGKVVILHFWKMNDPKLHHLNERLKKVLQHFGTRRLDIIGINLDEKEETAAQFLNRFATPWTHLHRPGGDRGTAAMLYGERKGSAIFLVDKTGRLVRRDPPADDIQLEIEKLID